MLLCKFVNLYNISINCIFFILIIDMSIPNEIMNSIFENFLEKIVVCIYLCIHYPK